MSSPLIQGGVAIIKCSEGSVPKPLVVLPQNRVMGSSGPIANIMDHKVGANITGFGTCGVLKPPVCAPVISSPWSTGSPTVLVAGQPALTKSSKCKCALGGEIQIVFPGPPTTAVP